MYKTRFLRWLAEKTLLPIMLKSGVRPESLLVFRLAFAFVTGAFLLYGDYLLSVVFLTIYQFVFLLDYVDGKIARKRKLYSVGWNTADRIGHYLVSFWFLFALTLSYFNSTAGLEIFLLGSAGSISILLTLLAEVIMLNTLLTFKRLKQIQKNKGIFTTIYSFFPIDGPFTIFYFLVLFDLNYIAIIFLSIMQFLILVKKIHTFTRWKLKQK